MARATASSRLTAAAHARHPARDERGQLADLAQRRAGSIRHQPGGGLYAGTGWCSSVARRADVTSNGTSEPFTGASFGTREDSGREIAGHTNLLGLNVTRKIFVPTTATSRGTSRSSEPRRGTGHYRREPQVAALRPDDRVLLHLRREPYLVGATSSGDTTVDASTPATADLWASLVVTTQDSLQLQLGHAARLRVRRTGRGDAPTRRASPTCRACRRSPMAGSR
ncbi:MAG: hypothetical protein QM736_02970 [Vicinamibacterales bacterium]